MEIPRPRYSFQIYVAAARIRVATDKRFGIDTPELIRRLARGDVDPHIREAIQRETARRKRNERARRSMDHQDATYSREVFQAAAELRVATDRRLGLETEERIKRLARGEIGEETERVLRHMTEGGDRLGADETVSTRRGMPRGARPRIRWSFGRISR